jgi:hypothetical protein
LSARSLPLHFYKRLFPELEPMTSWSQGNSFTAAPGLPFKGKYMYAQEKETDLAIQRTNANTEMEHILITRNWYKK